MDPNRLTSRRDAPRPPRSLEARAAAAMLRGGIVTADVGRRPSMPMPAPSTSAGPSESDSVQFECDPY